MRADCVASFFRRARDRLLQETQDSRLAQKPFASRGYDPFLCRFFDSGDLAIRMNDHSRSQQPDTGTTASRNGGLMQSVRWFVLFSVGFSRSSSVPPRKLEFHTQL